MTELQGKLIEIIYYNEANGYTVAFLSCEEEDATIVGILPTIKEGEEVCVKGKWIMHPSYGRQFELKEYRSIQPTSIDGIISYLSSGIIKGIGEKMANRIVEKFGEETLEIMEQTPHRLIEISGIGEAKAESIANAFQEQRELKEIVFLLSQYGVTPVYAVKIYKKYGQLSVGLIQENPYRLADDINGIGFKMADQIAKSMGVPTDSMYRIQAATKYVLNSFNGEGHTYAPMDMLINRTKELINVTEEQVNDAITNLALEQKIHLERVNTENVIAYSMPYYYAETNTCKRLVELSQVTLEGNNISLEEMLNDITQKDGIELADKQKEAICQAVENGIMVITGGPGTGKTTTINTIIKVFEKLEKKIMLAAPTGRASKRVSEATGREAKTIHRLLEMGFSDESQEMSFIRNEEHPLEADVVIIDEASMIDILLMNSLLKAIVLGTRVILVGDVDQLPSVGAGNVLKDIIDSNIVKVVRLNEIFRQAQESMIIVNAHRINGGILPISNEKDKDFFFIRNKKEDMVNTLISLVKDRLPKHYNLDSLKDIQMLTPMKKGETGTINLNKALQANLNPPGKWKAEKEYRDKCFRVGDKVMQIKNNYTLKWTNIKPESDEEKGEGVFNGDIGYIHSINVEDQEMTVIFDDNRLVIYDFSQLDELELAYCVTVHKSQGSEFSVVVMPITWGPPMLLTRNLLYTAVTRARNLVVLVGNEGYLQEMVQNNRIIERYSGLSFRLKRFFDLHRLQ
ncbi:SF1B family DNA helicase RecD2 [Alkaliphilus peptidifermentans]|uniref:ATP-dependent RecD2 DNA helicase n=1 Tax=Alkaliphilus peptidifermentans DSM 18978 TaxID=1120976 RepID=A0A1G5JF12_9FIRM|nr:ATP-dependent RecD-like DNA helicase [Alkaliphilus peptidifermentans]SCY86963.1 ATP-dependent DNA helicase, RecD/TraA family [Alkaliphilus peptidifermentans DSM 18978]